VADFFLTEVEFYWRKQQNRVLCHPLRDLGVMYTVYLWLLGKRVVDFLLVLIEHFCQLSQLRRYEWISVEIVVFKRGLSHCSEKRRLHNFIPSDLVWEVVYITM